MLLYSLQLVDMKHAPNFPLGLKYLLILFFDEQSNLLLRRLQIYAIYLNTFNLIFLAMKTRNYQIELQCSLIDRLTDLGF